MEAPVTLDNVASITISEQPLSETADAPHKKRKFTAEEDQKIRQLVQEYGAKQWDVIAKQLNNRTARQCRDRWKHYLSPSVIHREWTLEEDRLLLSYTQQYGPQWAALVKFFPGRTDINLKNRWNKLQRKSKKLSQNNPNVQVPTMPTTPAPVPVPNQPIPSQQQLQQQQQQAQMTTVTIPQTIETPDVKINPDDIQVSHQQENNSVESADVKAEPAPDANVQNQNENDNPSEKQ